MLRPDIDNFLNEIPKNVKVVAATKYVDSNLMLDLYNHGVKDFGENRVDSFIKKYNDLYLYRDIKWHFIGHLQRNKCKDIINKIDVLHSLDSIDLAKLINKYRTEKLDCFIEVSINLEENKNGVNFNNIEEFISKLKEFDKINIVGFMMMAIKNDLDDNLSEQFHKLYLLRNEMEKKFNMKFPYLSMGMSDDYKIAIKEGATHIRLGRILWNL